MPLAKTGLHPHRNPNRSNWNTSPMPPLPYARRLLQAAACPALLIASAPAAAEPIPDQIRDMIMSANPGERGTVGNVAKRAAPESAKEISALISQLNDEDKAENEAQLALQGFFDGWTGEGSIGGTLSTGNTDQEGLSASLGLDKRSLNWEHNLDLSFDYLATNGEITRERIYAGYISRFDLSGPMYFSFGLLSFERDRFSGLEYRFTESLGLGYRLRDSADFSWTIEGGPALRQTSFTDQDDENRLDLLGRTEVRWKPASNITLSESAGVVWSTGNSSLYSKSAATAKLVDNLSARVSFDVLHETEPPADREKTHTITLAIEHYAF